MAQKTPAELVNLGAAEIMLDLGCAACSMGAKKQSKTKLHAAGPCPGVSLETIGQVSCTTECNFAVETYFAMSCTSGHRLAISPTDELVSLSGAC